MIKLVSVEKSFGKTRVLDGVNLEVSKGEFLTLLGPSGSGKTTVLNIISGLLRPDRGLVEIGGEVVDDGKDVYVPPERRGVGYVFQSYALYPHMTARENIAFPLKMAKLPKEEVASRVAEVASMLGIEDILDKKPHQLSGGQRQRVALARALARRPRVLLMDEPFSNIDAYMRERVRAEVHKLVKRLGITTIMTTHDREEAAMLGDRMAVLKEGKFLQVDEPAALFTRPCCLDVAVFMGFNVLPVDGKNVAFRPEDAELGDVGDAKGVVLHNEYRGRFWLVYVDVGNSIVRIYSDSPRRPGEEVGVWIRRHVEV